MVPISAYYLGQEPPNLQQLRKTIGGLLHEEDIQNGTAQSEGAADVSEEASQDGSPTAPTGPEALVPTEHDERERSSETVKLETDVSQRGKSLPSTPLTDEHAPSPVEHASLSAGVDQPYSSATTELTESMEEVNLSTSPGLHGREDSQDLPTEEIDLS